MYALADRGLGCNATHGTHDTGSEGEPLPTAKSCSSPQASVGATMAEAKAAPVESDHSHSQNLGKLRPLFHLGEQVLVKAGPVPKGTSPYRGPYTANEALALRSAPPDDGD